MTKRAVLSYHLGADRDDVELAFRDEPLDEPRRGDAERVVGDEPDGELGALPLRIVPSHLAPDDIPECAPEDLVFVDVALGVDGADEEPALPVGAGHDCRPAGHRRPGLVAVGVDVAGVDGDHLDVGIRHRLRRHQDGAAVVADLLHAGFYAAELLRPLVELDGHGRRAPGGAERERDHVQHVLVGSGGLHRQAASGARPYVAAAAADKRPDDLAPRLPKILRLVARPAAGPDEDVRPVEGAVSNRLAVDECRRAALGPRRDLDPPERADVPSAVADEHGDVHGLRVLDIRRRRLRRNRAKRDCDRSNHCLYCRVLHRPSQQCEVVAKTLFRAICKPDRAA